jgi:hypothetical protein
LRLPGLRARQGPLRPWRSLEGAPTSGASSSPWYARLSGAGVPRQTLHSSHEEALASASPAGASFLAVGGGQFFSIILEHLSGAGFAPWARPLQVRPQRRPNGSLGPLTSFDPPVPLGLAQKPTDGPNVFWACTLFVHALCRPRRSRGGLLPRLTPRILCRISLWFIPAHSEIS